MRYAPIAERLARNSIPEPNTGCILWTAVCDRGGYARMSLGRTMASAHRVAYELANGPIPEGLDIDHKCRVRSCVNPEHLEPVSHRENIRRGECFSGKKMRQTTCIRGHELEMTSRGRKCFTCEATRGQRPWSPRKGQTHCKNGHEFTGDNLRIRANGQRACWICCRESDRRVYYKAKGVSNAFLRPQM